MKSTRRVPFEGHVYNFAVEDDESYVCEGFVSHNCGCELLHVPAGWAFNEDGDLVPESMLRSQLLDHDLRKADTELSYHGTVPDKGIVIHIGDPVKRAIIEKVVADSPPEIFDKRVGVTYITHDQPRTDSPMDEHDLGYWTGNEIRIATTLATDQVERVVRHELGHSLNVYLMYKWRGTKRVRSWHAKLYRVSKAEGFCSKYAKSHPIENAAELTRLYLYERKLLVLNLPRSFAMLDAAYRDIWRPRERPIEHPERPGEPYKQARDIRDERKRGGANL